MKAKKFDCVEMMHRGAERVREMTASLVIRHARTLVYRHLRVGVPALE